MTTENKNETNEKKVSIKSVLAVFALAAAGFAAHVFLMDDIAKAAAGVIGSNANHVNSNGVYQIPAPQPPKAQ